MKILPPQWLLYNFFYVTLLFVFYLIPNNLEFAQGIPQNHNVSSVVIGDSQVIVDLALTPTEQSKGLAVKDTIKENEGMLFIFESPKKHSFWMKDMKFPIDIIWIDQEGRISHIEKSLQPCIFLLPCPSFSPSNDSLYVLEVVSNFTNKYNVNVGDKVQFETSNKTN